MKIKLPIEVQHLDLDDHEKVIANLLLNVFYIDSKYSDGKAQKREWMKTEYYFYSGDLGRIMNTERLCGRSPLRSVFRIGRINEFTITCAPIKASHKSFGTPQFYIDEITDVKAIKNHSYLMGRFSYPEGIISKEKGQMLTAHPISSNKYASVHI
jgi:hypothetical protein